MSKNKISVPGPVQVHAWYLVTVDWTLTTKAIVSLQCAELGSTGLLIERPLTGSDQ